MIRYYTASEINLVTGWPYGSIHRLAHTERWRRTTDGRRPVLYAADDVDQTIAQRRTTTAA